MVQKVYNSDGNGNGFTGVQQSTIVLKKSLKNNKIIKEKVKKHIKIIKKKTKIIKKIKDKRNPFKIFAFNFI